MMRLIDRMCKVKYTPSCLRGNNATAVLKAWTLIKLVQAKRFDAMEEVPSGL